MFVHYEVTRVPIKIWLPGISYIEDGALAQAMNCANLPFVFKHVALMPDTHQGYGVPIGGVIATKGYISPNMVGVDIGCGVGCIPTGVPASILTDIDTPNGSLGKAIIGCIMRNIPCGMNRHKTPQKCETYEKGISIPGVMDDIDWELLEESEELVYQVKTLGGGNHFIELAVDVNTGELCILLHSGSRNFGKQVCDRFNKIARDLNKKYFSSVLDELELAFLPMDSEEGQKYYAWMNVALEFAKENRNRMLYDIMDIVKNHFKKYANIDVHYDMNQFINVHHNYAVMENHFGENVLVHRKGAIRMREGDLGVIPGAMGSYSYVVEGLGNPQSFYSASHGAGRKMGRNEAKRQFDVQSVMENLKDNNVILGKDKKDDVAEECMWAYKNIDEVMENQQDLVKPIRKLKTIGVIKG